MVSLGPHHYINQAEDFDDRTNSNDGPTLASLVELEHRKIERRQNNEDQEPDIVTEVDESSGSENENHSCEDEELVISPLGKQASAGDGAPVHMSAQPIETFAEPDDPYHS